jgi:hypothetical protein
VKKVFRNKFVKHSLLFGIIIFAIIGLLFVGVYFAVKLKLTNTSGIIDTQDETFWQSGKKISYSKASLLTIENYCSLSALNTFYPNQVSGFENTLAADATSTQKVLELLNFSAQGNSAYKNTFDNCLKENTLKKLTANDFISVFYKNSGPLVWMNTEEWQVFKEAVSKDKDILARVESETGIKARLLVAVLAAEQLRLFYSERPIFEQVFAPLKVLGSQSQFSWGIMGLKPDTAIQIENNLASTTSPFYLGRANEKVLAFTDKDFEQQRFQRITDGDNHYYAYLYSAIYIKQIIAQWQKSGFDISNRPEVLATLFNIGFANSKPKADPQVGGSELDIAGQQYSFGRLAYEFYYSGELKEFEY